MRKLFRKAAILATLTISLSSVHADEEKTKRIHFLQDDAQYPIVSKVYELKYVKANDITPFVSNAVERYYDTSRVERLSYYRDGKNKEYLVVQQAAEKYIREKENQ